MRKPLKDNPQYIFGSRAGQIVYNELKTDRYNLAFFSKHFNNYCKAMKNCGDIRDDSTRNYVRSLVFNETKLKMSKLFNDVRLPKKLLSFALNAVCYINKKHTLGKNL